MHTMLPSGRPGQDHWPGGQVVLKGAPHPKIRKSANVRVILKAAKGNCVSETEKETTKYR